MGILLSTGNAGRVLLRQVVEQASNRERLAIAQLDVGFCAPRRECRHTEALQRNPVGEVERADLGRHLQPDDVAGDGRRERELDAELLVHHRHGAVGTRALDDRNRNLAAGKKARFLSVVGNQVRLGQALEEALRLQRLDDGAETLLPIEEEEVEEVAEYQSVLVFSSSKSGAANCCVVTRPE